MDMDIKDSNQITRAYLDSLLVEMRHIDADIPNLQMELYGKRFDTPIMTAAFSHLHSFHPNGMVEMGRAARCCNAVNWVGMGSREELESILDTGASCIKVIKPYADRDVIFQKMEHARQAGVLAVGIDIDHSFNSAGQYDVVEGCPMKPVTADELRCFVRSAGIPFIVKGVLSVQDAVACQHAGVKGIVVSHHHGIIPYAVPPLMMLPKIKQALPETTDIFVDCGIDTGYDAFKAIALGAKAVCIGRAVLSSLKKDGAEGVEQYVRQAGKELACLMAHTGSADLDHVDASLIWPQSNKPADCLSKGERLI